jgi:hypothetical protein
MATAKVDTWKKTAAYAVDGLVEQCKNVAKQLIELDKQRAAIQDGLEKAAGEVSKKIKLSGFDEADREEVDKFRMAIFERMRPGNLGAFQGYGSVLPRSNFPKSSLEIGFKLEWKKN